MKRAIFFTFFLCSLFLNAQDQSFNKNLIELSIDQLEAERDLVHYDLNQIVKIIEDSIDLRKDVIIPENTTEFERLLFTARRIQHHDSQIVAINLFQNLLEFKAYRTKGEELYIKMLLAKSLDYIGATRLSYERMSEVFPDLLNFITEPHLQAFFLNHYSNLLLKIDSVPAAVIIYKKVLEITLDAKDSALINSCRNSIGYAYYLLGESDSSAYYLKQNQSNIFRKFNPTMHAFSFGNYSSLLIKEGQFDSAIYYCFKEMELLREIPTEEGLDNVTQSIAKAYQLKGNLDSALRYYSLSNFYSRKSSNIENLADNYGSMLSIDSQRDGDSIASYLSSFTLFKDSLQSILKNEKLNEELKTSEFFRIFSQAQYSREKYQVLKSNNQQLFLIIVGLASVLTILILILIYRYKTQKKISKANESLQLNNETLERSNTLLLESNLRNELLLKELHHRVKNNLQIVSSLFRLQMNAQQLSAQSKEVFKIAQDRIHSISLLHKKIYQSEDISCLDFSSYLQEFASEVLLGNTDNVKINLEVPALNMTIDTALPLGLIFNELFTNSIKHANVDQDLKIRLIYEKNGKREKFTYWDNGTSYEISQFQATKQESLGRELIELLALQLEAEISFDPEGKNEKGFWLSLEGEFSRT